MDPFKGITVQVISNDQTLESYNDPDSAEDQDQEVGQIYAEAITGATFKVKVTVTDEFPLYQVGCNDAVRFTISFDAQHRHYYKYLERAYLEEKFRRGAHGELVFAHTEVFSPKDGQWTRSQYTFGSLELGAKPY